jgi:endogenous inhibitor of DNA gyrase (YacG/DUF329 family)
MFVFRCPTCHREVQVEQREDLPSRPFCSKRCREIDLKRWLDGEYSISEPLWLRPEFGENGEEDLPDSDASGNGI